MSARFTTNFLILLLGAVCFAIVATGAAVSLYVFILGRARLQVPDIARWEEHGEPAWESPPLAAGIRHRHVQTGDQNRRAARAAREAEHVEALARAPHASRGQP